MASKTPSPGLNVIALVSGGKDSLYSILHCIRNGHRVVALANLHPEIKSHASSGSKDQGDEEDIDSFMYQTIGHSVIPLYEEALGIPLYRAPITGGAVDTSRIYRHDAADQSVESGAASEDETECLVPLLHQAMQAHPEANAVSAGAILSTYQRTRIENVAGRLGLTPLAWLWMYPSLPAPAEREADPAAVREAGLLEDMSAVGCDARIIKVASGGLDDGFLWDNVSESGNGGRAFRRRVVKAMSRFAAPEDIRGAVLGEGGEYETLAIDGPGLLWKKRIEIEERESRTAEGGVAYTSLKGAKCVPKSEGERPDVAPQNVRRPVLLDSVFAAALGDVSSALKTTQTEQAMQHDAISSPAWLSSQPMHRQTNTTWTISNIIAPEAGPGAGEQMTEIVAKVQGTLKAFSQPRKTEDIVFATVLLRSMADFASMNKIYVSLFKKPNPPARATIACGDRLPVGVNVMISFVVDLGARSSRQGLHVQSRSYWAPANIGPYSQAMSIPLQDQSRLVYVAGQIPLEPASMEMASQGKSWLDDYSLRTTLALQHMWRIGEAMQVDWWVGAVVFLTRGENIQTQVRVAWHLWKTMHTLEVNDEDEEDDEPQIDAWDIKYGRQTEDVVAETWSLPRFGILDSNAATSVPPFLAVEVDELPRGSDIEWQGLGSRCADILLESQADSTAATADGRYSYTCIEIASLETASLASITESLYMKQGLSQAILYTTQPVSEGSWAGQVVPCRTVWGREGKPLAAGVVLQQEFGSD
ncbi:hypothetical protein N7532_009533 [Penicillium argentinense]|uniref:Diphthine--ammonia ligase n=1 Tax=Penicillium argentinense TaxID=1131581 RepID=A0A9W9EZP1_9EURO|nr:uncharacterized protein N7532_009533 [Penicillium argentinense]KAJ5090849.1 hypothetical protein N7532_009533 [Penicillium argentinense]